MQEISERWFMDWAEFEDWFAESQAIPLHEATFFVSRERIRFSSTCGARERFERQWAERCKKNKKLKTITRWEYSRS